MASRTAGAVSRRQSSRRADRAQFEAVGEQSAAAPHRAPTLASHARQRECRGELGEPSVSVRELDSVAALAPMETELAMMTAVHRVAAKEVGLPPERWRAGAARPRSRRHDLHHGHGAFPVSVPRRKQRAVRSRGS